MGKPDLKPPTLFWIGVATFFLNTLLVLGGLAVSVGVIKEKLEKLNGVPERVLVLEIQQKELRSSIEKLQSHAVGTTQPLWRDQ